MKRISLLAISALVIGILACGGGSDDGTTTTTDDADDGNMSVEVDLPTVPITDPWKAMNLPTNSGQVVLSDSTVLLVAYQNGSISGITSDYSSAIVSNGWAKSEDYSTPDFTAILYTKGAEQIGFASGMEQGLLFAYMEDLSKVSDSDSAVKSARSGKPAIKRAGKFNRGGKRTGAKKGGSGTARKPGGGKKGSKSGH